MSDTMNLNVRISGSLKEYVQREVTEGDYESASEYVRDLIRRHKRAEEAGFADLKAHLQEAAAAPDSAFEFITADDIYDRVEGRKAS
jgi:putative addiction module CopG family antidote